MAESSLGRKHICINCETKFYDLGKKPAICPKCGTAVKEEEVHYVRPAPKPKAEKKSKNHEFDSIKLTADMDSSGSMDDSDDDIKSLSELDDRPQEGQHVGHDDDVVEGELMEKMQNYDVLLDKTDQKN